MLEMNVHQAKQGLLCVLTHPLVTLATVWLPPKLNSEFKWLLQGVSLEISFFESIQVEQEALL